MKGPHHSTAPAHDWRRTHAVLVAVEEYEGGPDWELDGPVRDALGMLEWLLGQGVPRDNVHLLASPLERNESLLATAAPSSYRPASRTNLRRLFREELRALDSEWLWVFWAGHGVQARGDRWSLLYPESHGSDLLGLDAENLVHLLRTDRLPQRGVDRVTFIVDACRQPLPGRQQDLAAEPDRLWERPQTRSDRRIFQMRAARPGGVAKNREEAGLFTSVLLGQLKAAARDGASADLERVWAGVHGEFERLHAEERLQQFPTLHVSNWNDEARDYSFPPPLRGSRHRQQLVFEVARLLTAGTGVAESVAAELCGELDGPPPATTSPSAGELVDWALAHPHGLASLLDTLGRHCPGQQIRADAHAARRILQPGRWLTAGEYDALLVLLDRLGTEDLRAFAGAAREEVPGFPVPELASAPLADDLEGLSCTPQRLPQLLRVTERFVTRYPEAPPATALGDWSLSCATRIGKEAALLDRRAEAEESAATERPARHADADCRIQVRLRPPDGPGQRRRYEVWSRRGTDLETLATADAPASAEEIQRDLDTLLDLHARTQETLVEFFLAATDLELEVHRWQRGLSGPVERSLGTDFPVVVRCTDLREASQRHLWQRRWERVSDASTEDLHWLPDHLEKSRQVYGALQERDSAPGVVMTTPRRARSEVFNACLYGGVPVLVWHSEAERASAKEQLQTLLARERLRSLPHHLRKLRSASDADDHHPGRNLALLWDDPRHPLPGRLHLSAP